MRPLPCRVQGLFYALNLRAFLRYADIQSSLPFVHSFQDFAPYYACMRYTMEYGFVNRKGEGMSTYDLIILGGGPAGYRAAEIAGHGGLRTLLIEERRVGGVCLHEGCIPTKTLLHTAHMVRHMAQAQRYGIAGAEAFSIDHAAVVKRKDKIVRILESGIRSALKTAGVDLSDSSGQVLGKDADGFLVETGQETYAGKRLLLCMGSEAVVPPIPGLMERRERGFVLTSREALSLTEVPRRLVIVGGGVIGLEMADYFSTAGSEVTVVEMLSHIGGDMDFDMHKGLQAVLQKRGVTFHLGCKVSEIHDGAVTCQGEKESFQIECDSVLICIGRRPRTGDSGLESLELAGDRIPIDEYGRTAVPGVYAAGDVTGECLLAHTAYRQAEVCVNHMLGIDDRLSYRAIPSVVYTHPEYATVGETEESVREKNIPAKVISLSMRYSGRFVVENEGGDGLCKLVINRKDGRLIGAQCLGDPASEMIFGMALAIENGLTVEQIRRTVFPHPTVSEIFRETAFRLP
jgi:dihydrolipoamide dehydrogenase